jgi:hypothetical protein
LKSGAQNCSSEIHFSNNLTDFYALNRFTFLLRCLELNRPSRGSVLSVFIKLTCSLTLERIVNVHNFVDLRCRFKKVDNIWLRRVDPIEIFVVSQPIRCVRNAVQFRRVVHEKTSVHKLLTRLHRWIPFTAFKKYHQH